MDRAEIDGQGRGRLFFGRAAVESCRRVDGQEGVFLLRLALELEHDGQLAPRPGQFYMLRSARSAVQLGRPVSVYSSCVVEHEGGGRALRLGFLLLRKGKGTQELCSLHPGDLVEATGPLGNAFTLPEGIAAAMAAQMVMVGGQAPVCVVGGGIGVAPVAYYAASLPPESYDFFASFKTGSYGLDGLRAASLTITTDDGSVGVAGMLPAAFTSAVVRERGYKVIYACGPSPMLAYVRQVAAECGVPCYLSMERQMACGVGACLGCTIRTAEGVRRVCKDGPVFDAHILEFGEPEPRRRPLPGGREPDLGVNIAGLYFANPVIAASGTFGFGQNYRGLFDVNELGGICAKGCTLEPRDGNPGERLVEVASGDINSIGLQNPGIPAFIRDELPEMLRLRPVAIANLAGGDLESYVEGARLLGASPVHMIELNISCPNVRSGGQMWGMDGESAATVVGAVRAVTGKPLMVKLSPNAPDVVGVALACVRAGADALSLVNTVQAVAIDIEHARPVFANVRAGLCGPAIKPIALRMVYDVVEALGRLPPQERVPVVGVGGIASWQDAVEFIMAGAAAVQVGTATFSNPRAMLEIIAGLREFMRSHGYASLAEMRGIAQVARE